MLSADVLKRRIAAIRLLRGISQAELQHLLHEDGLGKGEAGRVERGNLPLNRVRREALARRLRVPERWFTEEDVDVLLNPPEAEPEDVGGILTEIAERLAGLEVSLSSRLRGVGAPTIPGDTGRRLEAHRTSEKDRPRQDSEPAENDGQGAGR